MTNNTFRFKEIVVKVEIRGSLQAKLAKSSYSLLLFTIIPLFHKNRFLCFWSY